MRLFVTFTFIFFTLCAHGITLRATSGDLSSMNSGSTEREATERVINSISLKNELANLDLSLTKTVINFNDPIFEECVRSNLGKKTEAITSFDVSGISSMKCSSDMNILSIFNHMSHKSKVIVEYENNAIEFELIKGDGEDYINIAGEGVKGTIGAGQVASGCVASFIIRYPSEIADQEHNFQPDPDQDPDDTPGQTEDPYDDDEQQCVDTEGDDDDDDDSTEDTTEEDSEEEEDETDDDTINAYDDYDSGYGVGATGASEDEFNAGGQGIGQVVNTGDEDELGETSGGSDQGSIESNGVGTVINQVGNDELVSKEVSPVLKDVIDSVIGNIKR